MEYVIYLPGGHSPENDWLVLLFVAAAIFWSIYYTQPPVRFGFFLASALAVVLWMRWKTASDG